MFLDRFLLRLIHYIITLVLYVNSWWQKADFLGTGVPSSSSRRQGRFSLSWYYSSSSSNNNNKGQQQPLKEESASSSVSSPCTTLGKIRGDARELNKIPLHIVLAVHEKDFSYSDLCNVVIWSMAMGITYITVYEMHGKKKKTAFLLIYYSFIIKFSNYSIRISLSDRIK